MRFSAILFPVALLASFVAASPVVEERGISLTSVGDKSVESWTPAEPHAHASSAAIASGDQKGGYTGAAPISKRSDYNALAERANTLLILCTGYGCGGSCYGYGLPTTPYQCYGTVAYNSLYVSNGGVGLPYGVYVGTNCNSESSPGIGLEFGGLLAELNIIRCPRSLRQYLLQHPPNRELVLHQLRRLVRQLLLSRAISNKNLAFSMRVCCSVFWIALCWLSSGVSGDDEIGERSGVSFSPKCT